MKHTTLILAIMISIPGIASAQQPAAAPVPPPMMLTVPGFPDGGQIPVKFSQAAPGVAVGEGLSPALAWTNVPPGTQSFVIHMHDMDVSKNKGTDDQLHWLVWNIPGKATGLTEGQPKGQLPDGSYQSSATGQFYRGPGAAADGPLHHYVFEIYALDIPMVNVKPLTDELETRRNVIKEMQGHVLGKAVYGGFFRRPKP